MTSLLNVLLIGGGGREHALALKFSESSVLGKFYASPGNPGIAEVAECIELNSLNHQNIIEFCQQKAIDFVMIGPEAPLVDGLADSLRGANVVTFGPNAAAAHLEGSKSFTKDLCLSAHIPSALSKTFDTLADALAHIRAQGAPLVVKADGLAAGKGVTVAETLPEAEAALYRLYAHNLAAKVVIEEKLEGEELSFFALCHNEQAVFFGAAQDHKRVGEGETGANTGGMGAYSPAPILTQILCDDIMARIIRPTLAEMTRRGTPFSGMLFAGLMLTKSGPSLIEFNVRLGDPETQVLLPLLDEDVLELFYQSASGNLCKSQLNFSQKKALAVVLAAKPYPETPKRGGEIIGLETINDPEIIVTQAGTKLQEGKLVANGGRVLTITALGETFTSAGQRAYDALESIKFVDGFYRRDIGWRVL